MRDIFASTELKKSHDQQNSNGGNTSNENINNNIYGNFNNGRKRFDFTDSSMTNNNNNNNNNNNDHKSQRTKPSRKNSEQRDREEMAILKSQLRKLQIENESLQQTVENYQKDLNKYKAPLPRVVITGPGAPSPRANTDSSVSVNGTPKAPKNIHLKSKHSKGGRRPSGANVMAFVPEKELTQLPGKVMKKLDWKPIDNEYVLETFWKNVGFSVHDKEVLHSKNNSHARNSSMASELRDEFEYMDELKVPIEFEKLFCDKRGNKANRRVGRENSIFSPMHASSNASSLNVSSMSLNSIKHQIGIPDRRLESVRRVLKKIKLSPIQLHDCIINVDDAKINKEILYYLLEIAPKFEEIKYVLKKVNKDNVKESELNDVEFFFYTLAPIKHLELRLQLWIFKLKVTFYILVLACCISNVVEFEFVFEFYSFKMQSMNDMLNYTVYMKH